MCALRSLSNANANARIHKGQPASGAAIGRASERESARAREREMPFRFINNDSIAEFT